MKNQTQPTTESQTPVQPAPVSENLASQDDALQNQTKKSLAKWPLIVVGVILLATLLTGSFVLYKNMSANQKPALKTAQIITPTATPTPDPTANWQTYSTKDFSLKLPPGWTGKQIFNSPSVPETHAISSGKNGRSELNIAKENNNDKPISEKIMGWPSETPQQKTLTLGTATGTEYHGCFGVEGCVDEYNVYVQKGNFYYVFYFTTYPDDGDIYHKIISTLKFTGQTTQAVITPSPTPETNARSISLGNGYNQLISNKFHFSINYPSTFRNGCVGGGGDWCGDGSLYLNFPSPNNVYYISLANMDNPQNLSFKELATISLPQNIKDNFTYTTKSLNGYTIYETEDLPSRSGCLFTFVTKDGSRYMQISMCGYDSKSPSNEQDQRLSVFDNILSTFKFTQ